jgi:hypothetical protein
MQDLKASDLYKILDKMPNLKVLDLFMGDGRRCKFYVDQKFKKKLHFKHLRSLVLAICEVRDGLAVLEFLLHYLHENTLTEFYARSRHDQTEVANTRCDLIFQHFCSNQRSIKKLAIDLEWEDYFVDGIKFLTLDELKIIYGDEYVVDEVLRSQKKLKKLTFHTMNVSESYIKEVSKLSKLESLNLDKQCYFNDHIRNFKLLENLKHLKEFKMNIINIRESFHIEFSKLKLNSLEVLKIPGNACSDFFEKISENFPNLKKLEVEESSQKLNLFAKYFPKLQKLSVAYPKYSWLLECDTRIVHENLRELKLEILYGHIDKNEPKLLGIFEIFPNLISIKLSRVPVEKFLDLKENFKIIAQKVQKVEIGVSFRHKDSSEREKFEKIKKMFERQFKFVKEEINVITLVSTYKMIKN